MTSRFKYITHDYIHDSYKIMLLKTRQISDLIEQENLHKLRL